MELLNLFVNSGHLSCQQDVFKHCNNISYDICSTTFLFNPCLLFWGAYIGDWTHYNFLTTVFPILLYIGQLEKILWSQHYIQWSSINTLYAKIWWDKYRILYPQQTFKSHFTTHLMTSKEWRLHTDWFKYEINSIPPFLLPDTWSIIPVDFALWRDSNPLPHLITVALSPCMEFETTNTDPWRILLWGW